MEYSPRHKLPYIIAAQAQKHVTHNEAIRSLDALIQISLISRELDTPPSQPNEGDAYFPSENASGEWLNLTEKLVVWQDGAWAVHQPSNGWLIWIEDEQELFVFHENELIPVSGISQSQSTELQNLELLGVGTTATLPNALSVKADGTLLSHQGTDHRLSINKGTAADTASILLQSNWQSKAEIGLNGENSLSVGVSQDGINFKRAILIDDATAEVTLPHSNFVAHNALNLFPDSGRLTSSGLAGVVAGAFSFPSYFTLYNASSAAGLGKFTHNNNNFGGTGGLMDASIEDLAAKIRDPGFQRYGIEFWVCEVTQGAGQNSSVSTGGTTFYKSMFNTQRPRPSSVTFQAYFRAITDDIFIWLSPSSSIKKDNIELNGGVVITPAEGWVRIQVQDKLDLRRSVGYSPPFIDIYAKSEGDKWQFACPVLTPAITDFDINSGVIPSYKIWE